MILNKFVRKGTNFPGKIALKLNKNIIELVGKNYNIILITGTNGKTTTTNMIYNILRHDGKQVITNKTGANMLPGIVSCFIKNYSFFSFKNINSKKYAVIEVDEANLKYITKGLKPNYIIITNLFRDQLDRYGEVYTTLNKILEGIRKAPHAKLILNGDESLLGDLEDLPNEKIYYGFKCFTEKNTLSVNADAKFCKKCKAPYQYNFITYNHLGDYYCSKCGYKRPKLNYEIQAVLEQNAIYSRVLINNKEFYINQPGMYNIYNALTAYSLGKSLNVSDEVIYSSLKEQNSSFGRQETLNLNGKEIKIILVKNPAGYDQAINTISLDKRNMNIALLLNDNYADGRDVSWIWDVNFEKLNSLKINKILVSGIRLYDMAIRLKIAGVNDNSLCLCKDNLSLLDDISTSEDGPIYVLATYTAMMNLRRFLYSKGYIKKFW